MRMELYTGRPNLYETEEQALKRAATLQRTAGAWTGVRRRGDGTFSLLYDPWALGGGLAFTDGEQDDFAGSDLQLHRLPPGDGHSGQDLPDGSEVGEAAQ